MKSRKTIFVLGGGGIKPFAALPLLEFLRERNIRIDHIVGCSGGAMIGAFHSKGFSTREIIDLLSSMSETQFFRTIKFKNLFGYFGLPGFQFNDKEGVVDPIHIHAKLKEIFGTLNLENLSIPLAVQVTNLDTGKGYCVKKGSITDALYASSTIYPFMESIEIDGSHYVDGSFSDPIPVEEALKYNPDVLIIATFIFKHVTEPSDFFRYFNNQFCLAIDRKANQKMDEILKDYHGEIIHVKFILDRPRTIYETAYIDEIIEVGKKTLEKYMQKIMDAYE